MKNLLIFISTLVLTAASTYAQNPRRLSLEIKYNNSLPPAYISVRGVDTKPRWIWVTQFSRIPNGEPADALPIHAVRVESQFNGETADVKISLLRGRNEGFEREDAVATYHLGINEQTLVTELQSFGVEPITLKLIETAPPLPPVPTVENHTKSIEVVSVTPKNVPLPAYKVVVKNLSQKTVQAIRVDVISNGRPRLLGFWQNELNKPLIEPGGTLERNLQVVIPQLATDTYAPGVATENTIRLRSAIFDDLTFEGEEDSACRYETFAVGRRLWLRRVLPFMDQELANEALSPADFKVKFEVLTYELEEHEKTGKSAVSSKCPNPDSMVAISTQTLKIEMLRDLDKIINERPAPPINFRAWLETKRNDYRGWLERLK